MIVSSLQCGTGVYVDKYINRMQTEKVGVLVPQFVLQDTSNLFQRSGSTHGMPIQSLDSPFVEVFWIHTKDVGVVLVRGKYEFVNHSSSPFCFRF
jgi:hypothetical protein